MKIWVADWDGLLAAYRDKSVLMREIEEALADYGWSSENIHQGDNWIQVPEMVTAEIVDLQ
jgi:hypothetical protein